MHRLVLVKTFAALVAPFVLGVLVHKLLSKRRTSAQRNAEDPKPDEPSPSVLPVEDDYDVFLSFRGVDTRKGFTDHLYWRLADAGIRVFRDDDELHTGESIGLGRFKPIKKSKILIPIISSNYASSRWCLDELVYMMDCKKRSGQLVLPVFYRVAPADVRGQEGSFGEAFDYYGLKRFDPEAVGKWRKALAEVGSLKGLESERVADGRESELIKLIVQKVMNELNKAVELDVSKNLVGIDGPVAEVMKLVNLSSGATLCVGIYGIGGIGKTTLVKIIYNELSHLFKHCSFIPNIKESCKRNGIKYLQNKLISDILGKEIQYDKNKGIDLILSKIQEKKVLVILDDVDTIDHFKALVGNSDEFAPGSRIIVTTRDKSVLDGDGMNILYEHKEMNKEQSLILFSRYAFRRDSPPSEFLSISNLVVSTIRGLPLVLEVLGSHLCGKGLAAWEETIDKLQSLPLQDVQEKLRISYNALDNATKEIFLDIACFLIGSDARVASYMWDACHLYSAVGIERLRFMSLIKIGDNHKFGMHDQVRNLGRELVNEENYHHPHKRSRLWDYDEALKVLKRNKGTGNIQAIRLEKGNSTGIADEDDSVCINDRGSPTFTPEQFVNLPNLRFLHMSDVNLIGDFTDIFSELRWLKWGNCPSNIEVTNLHVDELVILDLSGSTISDDWQGWHSMEMAKKLKVLNLTGCHSLKRTSCLSAFKRLEILILRDCSELEQIDTRIGDMRNLISLDLSGCLHLKELPFRMAKLLQLKELLLDETAIRDIPPFISSLEKLETLSANNRKLA